MAQSVGGTGSPTPSRRCIYEIQGPQYRRNRSVTTIHRTAEQIRRVDARQGTYFSQVGLTQDVMRVEGGAWILKPLRGELVNMTTEGFPGTDIGDATVPPNYSFVAVGKQPDLSGRGATGLLTQYPLAIRKRVPHTGGVEGDWGTPGNNTLPADLASYPSPPLTQNSIPHDRVLLSQATFGENNAFTFIFSVPEDYFGTDALFRILFGGHVDTTPSVEEDPRAEGAGSFCLSVRGSGQALLYERNAANGAGNQWDYRKGYHWYNAPPHPGIYYSIAILPYGRDRLLLGTYATHRPASGFVLNDIMVAAAMDDIQTLTGTPHALYTCVPQVSGHSHQLVMTGGGPIRLDARRDIRTPFGIYRVQFPETGVLTDDVFTVTSAPAGSPMKLEMDVYTEALGEDGDGSSVEGLLFNADTLMPLSTDTDGNFLTEEGASGYYAQFTMACPGDRRTTPALYSYTVTIPMRSTLDDAPWIRVENVKQVSITGPDSFAPDHETMAVAVKDLADTAAVLQQRGRVHARLRITDRQDNPICTLFEGETMRPAGPRALKRGRRLRPNANASKSNWHDYASIPHNGMWVRVADQWMAGENQPINFARDPTAPEDPKTNDFPAWKITDAIRKLFDVAGVHEDQLDIPDLDMRFVVTPKTKWDDLLIIPGNNMAHAIQHLVRDYLGWTIFFEPNAFPHGRWRLRPPANLLTDPIRAEFHTFGSQQLPGGFFEGNGPRVMTAAHAYDSLGLPGVAQTYIKDQTFHSWVEPPEANAIRVVGGPPQHGSDPSGWRRIEANWRNFRSFDFDADNPTSDPSDISYLDAGKVQVVYVDPMLQTQEMVDFVLLRLAAFIGIGRKWATWRSPLVTFYDPDDPFLIDAGGNLVQRPLRPQDLVLVHNSDGTSNRAIIPNCNPDIRSTIQEMEVEALILPNEPPPPGLF